MRSRLIHRGRFEITNHAKHCMVAFEQIHRDVLIRAPFVVPQHVGVPRKRRRAIHAPEPQSIEKLRVLDLKMLRQL